MKGRKFLIVGGLVVAGVVAYEVCKHFCRIKDNRQETKPHAEGDFYSEKCDAPPVDPDAAPAINIYETKATVADSVKERHYEVAKVMEESLNVIFRENEKETIVTENSDTLSKTSNDLNELLK